MGADGRTENFQIVMRSVKGVESDYPARVYSLLGDDV